MIENPLAPFYVGAFVTLLYGWYAVVHLTWTGRHNHHEKFDYDSDLRLALAWFRDDVLNNIRWFVIVLSAGVVGIVVTVVWWTIAVLVGVSLPV